MGDGARRARAVQLPPFVRRRMVAPTNVSKVWSSSSDPLLLLALLARAGRSTSWRTSTAAAASFMEDYGCAALLCKRCCTASRPRPGQPVSSDQTEPERPCSAGSMSSSV